MWNWAKMNRREFLALSSTPGLGMLARDQVLASRGASAADPGSLSTLKLLPYPQELEPLDGALHLGKPEFTTAGALSRTEEIAMDGLRRLLPLQGRQMIVRLGSLEEGYDRSWLSGDEAEFLASERSSPQAGVLRVTPILLVDGLNWNSCAFHIVFGFMFAFENTPPPPPGL
jgi:hypothetical protein